MTYSLLIFFGLAPSIIWLLFYLRKDVHPESNVMVLKIFGLGALVALPTAVIELGIVSQLELLSLPPLFYLAAIFLVGVALPEEMMKYAVVRIKVLCSPEFDEPVDIMLYMIVAALGFAALENILLLSPLKTIGEILTISWIRLLGGTLLHTLCSGLIGYFLALSFYKIHKRLRLTLIGLTLAIVLHGLYDFLIMIEGITRWLGPIIILISLTVFVSFGFREIKKLKSVCHLSSKKQG